MNSSLAVILVLPFSWGMFIASMLCHMRYDATLRGKWRAASALVGMAGVTGTIWLYGQITPQLP